MRSKVASVRPKTSPPASLALRTCYIREGFRRNRGAPSGGRELTFVRPRRGSLHAPRGSWPGLTCKEKAPHQTQQCGLVLVTDRLWDFFTGKTEEKSNVRPKESENTWKTAKEDALMDQDNLCFTKKKKKKNKQKQTPPTHI